VPEGHSETGREVLLNPYCQERRLTPGLSKTMWCVIFDSAVHWHAGSIEGFVFQVVVSIDEQERV